MPALAAQAGQDAQLRQVTLQLKWTHQFQFAGYYAAIAQGYYREAGLDVQLLEYTSGISQIDQLLGGRVQFAVSDTGALLYRANGTPLIALAAIFQNSPSILVTLADSGIESLSALAGKRVMLAGGFMNAELTAMLKTVNITIDDINIVPTVTDINALLSGTVDAINGYTTNEIFGLDQRGIAHRVFHPIDFGVDFYGDILLTTEALVAAEPELVAAFRAASIRGWEYAVANQQEIVDLILEQYNQQQKSREHLLFEARESVRLILPNIVPIGYMSQERWQHIAGIFRQQGLLERDVDLNAFIYQEAIEQAPLDFIWEYRRELALLGSSLAAIFLFLHIISLRRLVDLRTVELQAAKLQAEAEARTDVLTGMPNRRQFFEALEREVAQSKRYRLPLAVMTLDIDHFKNVNDTHGHAMGDEVLRRVAAIFQRQCRSGDLAARVGGEEFAFASLNMHLEDCKVFAERLRNAIAQTEIRFNEVSVRITLSIGICMMEDGDTVGTLLQKSDEALYAAKAQGRNRVCLWQEG